MKTLIICIATIIFLLLRDAHNARAASLKCSTSKPIVDLTARKVHIDNNTEDNDYDINNHNNNKEGNKNSLKKIFQNIDCTLEKAKPLVEELQQEAKRLQEVTKLVGLSILNSFGELVEKLVDQTADNKTVNTNNSTVIIEEIVATSTEDASCSEGFVADEIGICVQVE